MKKSKKIMLKVIPVLFLVFMVFVSTSAIFGITPTDPATGTASGGITTLTGNIWSTAVIVIQTVAIASIVIAGIRYMFAPAEVKSDIKQQTIILVVGAVLVFAAVPIAKFIQSAVVNIIPS